MSFQEGGAMRIAVKLARLATLLAGLFLLTVSRGDADILWCPPTLAEQCEALGNPPESYGTFTYCWYWNYTTFRCCMGTCHLEYHYWDEYEQRWYYSHYFDETMDGMYDCGCSDW
jgi:hypothetical protein